MTPDTQAIESYRPIEELIPAHWQSGMVQANGLRHHYWRTGDATKPPVVLIHGILDSALTWLRTALALEGEYDVIMPDSRGHGRSDRVGADGAYTTALLADDAADVIAQL